MPDLYDVWSRCIFFCLCSLTSLCMSLFSAAMLPANVWRSFFFPRDNVHEQYAFDELGLRELFEAMPAGFVEIDIIRVNCTYGSTGRCSDHSTSFPDQFSDWKKGSVTCNGELFEFTFHLLYFLAFYRQSDLVGDGFTVSHSAASFSIPPVIRFQTIAHCSDLSFVLFFRRC